MFAEVYPVTRLPRRFGVFDYTCNSSVSAGDLVRIPLKGRSVLGVVKMTKESSEITKKLAPIERTVISSLFDVNDIARTEEAASLIVQSPSTLFHQTLIGIEKSPAAIQRPVTQQRATLSKDDVERLKTVSPGFIQGSLETCVGLVYRLAQSTKGQLLVIAPHEIDVTSIASHLPERISFAHLHGHTPHNQRASIIRQWRDGSLRVLIGSKQTSLLPAKNISSIVVFEPTHIDHTQYDRNPRFNAVAAAKQLANQHNADLYYCGSLPKISFEKNVTQITSVPLIDLKAPDQKTGFPFLSESLKRHIEESLRHKKRSIVLYNKKGYAKRLQCKDCQHIPYCGSCGAVPKMRKDDLACSVCHAEMWIPKNCPSCGGENLRPRGIGNAQLKKQWATAFPAASISIIDKDQQESPDADILLVTEYFFQTLHRAFKKWNADVVADACADLHMGFDTDASIQAASRIHRLALFARWQKASCLIQTWTPEAFEPMSEIKTFLSQERSVRSEYHLPPLWTRITITSKTEISDMFDDLLATIQHSPDIHHVLRDQTLEIFVQPTQRGLLDRHLQELPDSCIIRVTYD